LDQQQHKWAEEAISRAEAEAPDDLEVLGSAAALHEEMGHTDTAISIYELAIERSPASSVPYARLGAIYRRRMMPTEARTMYELAAERAGDDPAILFDLAQLRLEEDGATPDVLNLLEQTVHLDPERAHARLLLGDMYLKGGEAQEAIEQYEMACELTTPDLLLGQEARRKLAKLRPALPEQTQGWGTTLRLMAGLLVTPALAALVNARLAPWEISLAAWGALVMAAAGAYLWVCVTDVPCNPLMCTIFGQKGVKESWQKTLAGLPGVLLWGVALGLILLKV
jgi:tetratricopeptide (TPR) repeat protein